MLYYRQLKIYRNDDLAITILEAIMTHLRVAAVQLDFQPVTRTPDGAWLIDEPIANITQDNVGKDSYLYTLSGHDSRNRDIYDRLMTQSRTDYIDNLRIKLKEIMTFCFRQKVDLVVFPEYSLPINVVDILRSFSTKMAIVAGLGYLQYSDIEIAKEYGFDISHISHANNVAALLSPTKNILFAKKYPATNEQIESGDGKLLDTTIELEKGEYSIGGAICLDYIRERTHIERDKPKLVIIPALTKNIEEFVDETPRDYIRVFANHAAYGGTYIGLAGIKGLSFVDKNGTTPLPKGVEGIIIVDLDPDQPYLQVVPSTTFTPDHRLVARANLIYQGRDIEIANRLSAFDQTDVGYRVNLGDLLQTARDIQQLVERAGSRYKLLQEALNTVENIGNRLSTEETRALARHCILSANARTISEWRYRSLIGIAERLKTLLENVPEIASSFSEYEKIAREISKDVRDTFIESRHRGVKLETESPSSDTQLVLFARLGSFGTSQAIASLEKQLKLLRVIADQQDQNLVLRYRLQNYKDADGITHVVYDIICTTSHHTQKEIESLREGLGQVIAVTFAGAYSFSYTVSDLEPAELLFNIRDSAFWWAEIRRAIDANNNPLPFRGFVDWSAIINLIKRLSASATIEIECFALTPETVISNTDNEEDKGGSPDNEIRFIDFKVEGSYEAARVFENLASKEKNDPRRLALRVFIGSKEELPQAVIDSIGIELAGISRFDAIEKNEWRSADLNALSQGWGLTPVETLRIFHPPFGDIFAQTGEMRFDLDLPTNESKFPPGIALGKARMVQARSNQEIEVKLSELDRLKHIYILGKTGTGKTNLLKIMASQDVEVSGRGVTIIDPHGDLVDHVLRQIPEKRIPEVTLIDLARTDALPVINPLDIDRKDVVTRDRTVQELILLMRQRAFHQWTGPRFDEMMRLVLQTMLDEKYPESPSFVEVSKFLIDKGFQAGIKEIVQDKELKNRWDFQDTLLRDNETPGLIQYVISKFDDIARDSTLRCVIGGSKSTINIEKIVQENGILLVRIPEAVIGKQASDLIGSLILLQLRTAIIRRREFGKQQNYHFVYVDEFQNFANTDFHTIVAEARKFNIGFTLANQNLEQLREFRTYTGAHEERLVSAILGNVANLIIFGVGAFDAGTLSQQFNESARDILRIGRYQSLAKLNIDGFDTTAFTLKPPEALRLENPRIIEAIEKHMKNTCWVDREKVLDDINSRIERLTQAAEKAIKDKEELGRKKWQDQLQLRPRPLVPPTPIFDNDDDDDDDTTIPEALLKGKTPGVQKANSKNKKSQSNKKGGAKKTIRSKNTLKQETSNGARKGRKKPVD